MGLKLLLADDHTLFRDALIHYIERAEPTANISVAIDLHEVLDRLAEKSVYDLVLLDLRMPGMNGMDGFKKVRESYPHIKLCLMSGTAEAHHVEQAFELGASGYFPKTLSGKALLGAIQSVVDGQQYVPIEAKGRIPLPSYYDDTPVKTDAGTEAGYGKISDLKFTPRETEVLEHLVHGKSNKEIARELDLQVVTVKLHVRGICKKLNAENRTQAALRARELGFKGAKFSLGA